VRRSCSFCIVPWPAPVFVVDHRGRDSQDRVWCINGSHRHEESGIASARSQLSTFIGRFSPEIALDFRTARAHVRKFFPKGHELVYDNYNAFGCGYSTTRVNSGVLLSVVAYPRWVTLFFFHGKELSDPEALSAHSTELGSAPALST